MQDELISISKARLVVNSLGLGIALQLLARETGKSEEYWGTQIGLLALEQFKGLVINNPSSIDEICDQYGEGITDEL